ncbi:MAG TPA: serine/threonine-protein kinase [Thermoanaerobaculia bacterium]|jgi:serine/threonine protein kinase
MLEKIGKYEVSEQIGVGGFGAVYRGRDPFIKRTVAIKTCQVNDDEIKHRFFREAELAGNLHHRNITTIYDFGVENGIPYIVQEFLTGEDLDKKIKRGDPILVARKVEILMAIADGLAYAHNANIVHRDVKPANVRILDDGTVKVMDFGIAKSLQTESNLTQTGITLGTSAYLAPEQIRGEPIDRRTDIFSMGVLSYELLSYRKPFRGEHLSTVLYKILNDSPEPLETIAQDVPPALIAAVNRAISKIPDERYPTMEEYRQDLHAVFRELTGSSGMYARSLLHDAPTRATRSGSDEYDTTLATPSSGVGITVPANITPPSGALARQPAAASSATDRTPTSGARPPLELVNFRDPLADSLAEDPATLRRSSQGVVKPKKKSDSRILSIVALVVSVGAGVFLWMRQREEAPKPPPAPPAATAPTPALEFPEPKMGAGAAPAPGSQTETAAAAAAPQNPAVPTAAAPSPATSTASSSETAPSTSTAAGSASVPNAGPAPAPTAAAAPAAAAAPEKPPVPLKKYKVQFSSVPVATLSVDGKTIGPSVPARTISLEEGTHKVRFDAKGFPVHERTITVGADSENRVHYQFPISTLVIQAPAWAGARLLVDGKYRGNLPDVSPLKLPPGSYSVTLSREGVSPVTEKIRVPEGAEKTWNPPPPSAASSPGGTP